MSERERGRKRKEEREKERERERVEKPMKREKNSLLLTYTLFSFLI